MTEGIVFELKQKNAIIMTSDGQFLSVPAKQDWKVGKNVTISEFELKMNESKKKKQSKKPYLNSKVIIAIVASLLFFMIPLSTTTEASSFVTLDINPSVEMELNGENVVHVKPLNPDAEQLLAKIDESKLKGHYYEVTSAIIDQAKDSGYLKPDEENVIMVGLLNSNKTFEATKYEQYIKDKLSEKSLQADVLVLTATKSQKKSADKKGISLGKYALQEEEKEKGIIISDEEISKKSVKEIMKKIKEDKKNGKNNNFKDNDEDKDNHEIKNNNPHKNDTGNNKDKGNNGNGNSADKNLNKEGITGNSNKDREKDNHGKENDNKSDNGQSDRNDNKNRNKNDNNNGSKNDEKKQNKNDNGNSQKENNENGGNNNKQQNRKN